MTSARLLGALAVLGLAALMTFLVVETRAVDSTQHERFVGDLQRLQKLDATTNRDILKLRHAQLTHYDPLVAEFTELKATHGHLGRIPTYIDPAARMRMNGILRAQAGVLTHKETLIERFKSQNAVLNNSLSYFPILLSELAESAGDRKSPELASHLKDLLRDVLLYDLTGNKDLVPRIERQLHGLLGDRERWAQVLSGSDLDIVQAHVRMILLQKSQVDALTRDLLSLPLFEHGEQLYRVYSQSYERALLRAYRSRLYLYLLSVGLLSYVVYVIVRLKTATRALNAANEGLEQRVSERTRALVRSNEALRKSERNNHALLDAIPDSIWHIHKNGVFLAAKGAGHHELALPAAALVGKRVREALPPEVAGQTMNSVAQAIEARAPQNFEYLIPVHGQRRNYEARIVPSGEEEVLAIVRDVTERTRVAEELRRSKEAAEAASRAKSTFLANMSHELRTPLNAIIGYSEMLEEEAVALEHREFADDLRKIHVAGKHLLGLISEVLDLSKIEAGKMELHLESFALSTMVADVVSTIEPLAQKGKNALEVSCPRDLGAMHADVTKVRQCLLNLLGNACKFTEGGRIVLTVTRVRVADRDWAEFKVADSGRGMTAEQIENLFQPFEQAEKLTARKYGGTGLGLAITRKFCQMMGGDVAAESKAGEGSTFTIRLPAVVSNPKAAAVAS